MIKRLFLQLFLLSVFSLNTAQAQNKVVVIPLGSDTYQLSIEPAELFSWFRVIDAGDTHTVLTVPADKIFVMTQIVGEQEGSAIFTFFEDATIKTEVTLGASQSGVIQFGSGIPFSSSTDVKVLQDTFNGFGVTVIGHFSAAP